MRIAVEKRGGLFPTSRNVEIDDERVRVTETPEGRATVRRETPLEPADAERLRTLAARVVASGDQIDDQPAGVDGGTTVLRVDDGRARSLVEIRGGRSTGREVWDLLDEVDKLAGGSA